MVRTFQHPAGSGCQVRLKMRNFYALLIICGFTTEVLCTSTANGKQAEDQATSTSSSTYGVSGAQIYAKENFESNQQSDDNDIQRILRAVPRIKTTSSEDKSKNERKLDYVLKIPLSVLRQLELYRLIMLQEREENSKYKKRFSVIPIPRYGRSSDENEYDMEGDDNTFQYGYAEEDNISEEFLNDLDKNDNSASGIRNIRSILLLSAPKSEENTKEKPSQTFVLPYPRPGRSMYQNEPSKMIPQKNNDKKYILPAGTLGRPSSLDSTVGIEKGIRFADDWISSEKYSPRFLKLNKGKMSDTIEDKNDENSFFVIPYPRPGKKSMFKLKNKNQEQKEPEKEIMDYMLPYPRPGKKSEGLKDIDENFSDVLDGLSDVSDINGKIDAANIMENKENAIIATDELNDIFDTPNKKDGNTFLLPYLRTGRNFNNIVPYTRPGRSVPLGNAALQLFSDDMYPDQLSQISLGNSNGILRYKRSASTISYPTRLTQSNSVVPYPRLGRSNSVVPYPRLGRSNSFYGTAVPYTNLEQADSSIPYFFSGRLKRSSSVLPHPRLGRADSIVPYPRPGRSESVIPYPRLGRADSLVPYPRPGRADSLVPYPRPGRSDSIVPYPRPGRSNSLVPYPRPGRAESLVPYPRPGRSDSIVPYPRPGRSNSIVPYPRPGRSNSVVPYPRPGRSDIERTGLLNKYGKGEKWLLPNLRPGRSNLKQEDNKNTVGNSASNMRQERSVDENNSKHTIANSDALTEVSSINRYSRASDGQGYVLPHPRIGRSPSHARKKREDTDTVIPYPRLGRSQKETVPVKTPPETQNSVHKLNKHMLTSLEDSVYLLPYPRPGRYLE